MKLHFEEVCQTSLAAVFFLPRAELKLLMAYRRQILARGLSVADKTAI
jgi:hypothetical protein